MEDNKNKELLGLFAGKGLTIGQAIELLTDCKQFILKNLMVEWNCPLDHTCMELVSSFVIRKDETEPEQVVRGVATPPKNYPYD